MRSASFFSTAAITLALSAGQSFIFASASFLLQKYRKWSSTSLFYYVCEIAATQSLLFIMAPLLHSLIKDNFGANYKAGLTLSPGLFISTNVFILLVLALLHRAERSIYQRLKLADELTIQLEKNRDGLIFSDEELRKQTSQFLHDRVQSDLMVVSMKLKTLQGSLSLESEEVLTRAISKLENVRTADLRNLTQILTPNFSGMSFTGVLASLIEQYPSEFKVIFQVDENINSLDEKRLLGIYRITEQAILNSFTHGPASNVIVDITFDSGGGISLSIADDGPGVDGNHKGMGTSIINSWVAILKASKEIHSSPGKGYELAVKFKA